MTDVELDARVTALEDNGGVSSSNGSYGRQISISLKSIKFNCVDEGKMPQNTMFSFYHAVTHFPTSYFVNLELNS